MRCFIQRVKKACVTVEGNTIGQIGKGLLIFFGAGIGDTEELAKKYAEKIVKLRIFEDENGKTNRSLKDVGGELLVVSQFTLYADCRKGNRPSFTGAGAPDLANELYEYMIQKCRAINDHVETGIFGADMKVQLLNDGPFTIILDSEDL